MSGSRIAVIGLACRLPGAPNAVRFWHLLRDGLEGIRRFTPAELAVGGVDEALRRRPEYVPACGALEGIEDFDAGFFGLPPREAELMDPQHRVFLELAWEALEDAGYAGDARPGRAGVYAGAGPSSYLLHNLLPSPDLARVSSPMQVLLGNNKDSMPTRVSYRLNLRGPSMNISTACSTSLVAVHVACQALLHQECDVALAGGIGIQVPQGRGYLYEPSGILSPDGHCRAFDRAAAGTVSGNGGGIVVLKRLEDAEADGDAIRAVILGSAINNDGAQKAGYTAPGLIGQIEVVAEAMAVAEVSPDDLSYLETHGTGTPVGDPIEIQALTDVFRRRTARRQFCAIGSVKTNIGHLDEGAGAAGLIKTVLALEHRQIPASLHFVEPNPECRLDTSPFYVNAIRRDWPSADVPRRAGVSSFGIGGTNAHVVMEEAPEPPLRAAGQVPSLLTLSARSPHGLEALAHALAARLAADPALDLQDVAFTLQTGRRAFAHRRAIVCHNQADALVQLGLKGADIQPLAGALSATEDERRLRDLGTRWEAGETVDWQLLPDRDRRRRVSLPTTPFERTRCWIDPPGVTPVARSAPISAQVETWFHATEWTASARCSSGASPHTTVVFVAAVGERTPRIQALVEALSSRGAAMVTVVPGQGYRQHDSTTFEVRPGELADHEALVADLAIGGRLPCAFVHLWLAAASAALSDETILSRGFDSLLCLTRVVGARPDGHLARLSVVTDAAQSIEPDDLARPEHAAIYGLVRAMAVEYPSLACVHVDLGPEGSDLTGSVAEIASELIDPAPAQPVVAYRGGRRLVPLIRPLTPRIGAAADDGIRDGGVYLITGGLGSMGLALAEWIASRARVTLVLAARPAAEAKLEAPATTRSAAGRISAIEAGGSRVEVARVDVSDAAAVARLVTDVRARHGRIAGVVHTAGVIGRGLIRSKNVSEARRVLAPKLGGARALEAALADDPPDLFVACSGLASRYPVAGQADYAAANAALDGFAHAYGRTPGVRALSIGWGFWQELGLIEKSAMPQAEQDRIAAEILQNGWTTAGVEAFATILSRCDGVEVLVYPQGLTGTESAQPAGSGAVATRHPLLGDRRDEPLWTSFSVGFGHEWQWLLDEHRVEGQAVLPGTAYLEIIRAAFVEVHGRESVIELRDVSFLRPYMADPAGGSALRVVVVRRSVHTEVVVISSAGDDRWILHARADLVVLEEAAPAEPAKWFESATAALAGKGALPEEFARRMSGFGPHWDNVVAVRFDDETATAALALPARFESETGRFELHPALLDNASGYWPVQRQTEPRAPFSYGSVTVRGPLSGAVISRAVAHGVAGSPDESFDVVIAGQDGRVLVEVRDYRFRRLVAATPAASEAVDDRNAALRIGTRGALDTLSLGPATRRPPGEGEVEIRVEAAGVNFIETLYALGMLPEHGPGAFPFGLECAGTVVRTGAGVASIRVGQRVAAFANGSDRLFATVPVSSVAELPAGMSFEDAATIPGAYITAYVALVDQGRLQPGERVLIHSACGGVGLAAVHVARWRGARVLATAGTGEKRDYLRGMGIDAVMDSRSNAFAADTMAATSGAGVNVVLNSLAGDLIAAGLSVLSPGGRFLELGKRDIFAGTLVSMAHFEQRRSLIAIDVGPDLPDFPRLWREVWARVEAGDFPPLPRQVMPATEAATAFAAMARGRHIGKFVLSFTDREAIERQAAQRPADRGQSLAGLLGVVSVPIVAATTSPGEPAARADSRRDQGSRDQHPRDVEDTVAGIWQELLGRSPVGHDENFFDLDGDSLLGVQVISRIHLALGVKIPLSAIFDHPTVAGLAGLVRQASGATAPAATGPAGQMEEGTI